MRISNVTILVALLLGRISANNDYFLSVTSFPEIENFYLKAREYGFAEESSFKKPMRRTVGAQRDFCICKSILDSTHFKHRGISPLNWHDPAVKIELKMFHEALFEEFYPTKSGVEEKEETKVQDQMSKSVEQGSGEGKRKGRVSVMSDRQQEKSEREEKDRVSRSDEREKSEEKKRGTSEEGKTKSETEIGQAADENQLLYTLPYYELNVRVFYELVLEGTVLCLARTAKPFGVKPYFVSSAYHPRPDATHENRMYFVFRISGPTLVLEALAEEVAVAANKLTTVEKGYLKKRWLYEAEPTSDRHEDPICSLSSSTKLRICASIVGSEKYREELEFVPSLENVLETCYMEDVFLYGLSLRGGSPYRSEGLSEWMYGCKARRVGSAWSETHLLVSRSYDNQNSVYVYRIINGRYEMVDYFRNINALYDQ